MNKKHLETFVKYSGSVDFGPSFFCFSSIIRTRLETMSAFIKNNKDVRIAPLEDIVEFSTYDEKTGRVIGRHTFSGGFFYDTDLYDTIVCFEPFEGAQMENESIIMDANNWD